MKRVFIILIFMCAVFPAYCQKSYAQTELPKLQLSEILPNPQGTDLGYEWIELYNFGDTDIDISGYKFINTSASGSVRTVVVPNNTVILKNSFLVISEANVNTNLKVVVSKIDMFNSNASLKLANQTDQKIDEISYQSALDGRSIESSGIIDSCKVIANHPDSNSINSKNSNYDKRCYGLQLPPELSLGYFQISKDNVSFVDGLTSYAPTKVFYKYQLLKDGLEVDHTEVLEEIVNDDLGNIITNGEFKSNLDTKLNLKITLADGMVLEAKSGNVKIISSMILISEVFPSPNSESEEEEWIEIFNNSSNALNLEGYYLKDKGSNEDGFGNNKFLLTGEIAASSYLAFDTNTITLNNSGDTIGLFAPDGTLLSKFTYGSIKTSQSTSLISSDGFATGIIKANTIPSKNSQNQDLIVAIKPTEKAKESSSVKTSTKTAQMQLNTYKLPATNKFLEMCKIPENSYVIFNIKLIILIYPIILVIYLLVTKVKFREILESLRTYFEFLIKEEAYDYLQKVHISKKNSKKNTNIYQIRE